MNKILVSIIAALTMLGLAVAAQADSFKLVITQDEKDTAQKYTPLADYLKTKGVEVSMVGASDFSKAAQMFAAGEADGMFSGSSVASTLFIKNLATPLVRPVSKDGHSTYWEAVIAPTGAAKFTGSADYFAGKKVIFTGLASAEFYYHSLPGANATKATIMKAASHGAALNALSKGIADVAIVKNWIWEKEKSKYPNLTQVGEDTSDNPDGTLIVSKKANADTVKKVSSALLGLKDDNSAGAKAVRDSLNVKEFITTTTADFKHNMEVAKKAGVTESFNFQF